MESLPFEVTRNHIIRIMSYEDILHLCESNTEYTPICEDKSMWTDLLKKRF